MLSRQNWISRLVVFVVCSLLVGAQFIQETCPTCTSYTVACNNVSSAPGDVWHVRPNELSDKFGNKSSSRNNYLLVTSQLPEGYISCVHQNITYKHVIVRISFDLEKKITGNITIHGRCNLTYLHNFTQLMFKNLCYMRTDRIVYCFANNIYQRCLHPLLGPMQILFSDSPIIRNENTWQNVERKTQLAVRVFVADENIKLGNHSVSGGVSVRAVCPTGMAIIEEKKCRSCEPGSFSNHTDCMECPPESAQPEFGASQCEDCSSPATRCHFHNKGSWGTRQLRRAVDRTITFMMSVQDYLNPRIQGVISPRLRRYSSNADAATIDDSSMVVIILMAIVVLLIVVICLINYALRAPVDSPDSGKCEKKCLLDSDTEEEDTLFDRTKERNTNDSKKRFGSGNNGEGEGSKLCLGDQMAEVLITFGSLHAAPRYSDTSITPTHKSDSKAHINKVPEVEDEKHEVHQSVSRTLFSKEKNPETLKSNEIVHSSIHSTLKKEETGNSEKKGSTEVDESIDSLWKAAFEAQLPRKKYFPKPKNHSNPRRTKSDIAHLKQFREKHFTINRASRSRRTAKVLAPNNICDLNSVENTKQLRPAQPAQKDCFSKRAPMYLDDGRSSGGFTKGNLSSSDSDYSIGESQDAEMKEISENGLVSPTNSLRSDLTECSLRQDSSALDVSSDDDTMWSSTHASRTSKLSKPELLQQIESLRSPHIDRRLYIERQQQATSN